MIVLLSTTCPDTVTLSPTLSRNKDTVFDPAGTGSVVVVDDTFLAFGTDENGKIEYDEDGTDKVQVTGSNWKFNCTVEMDNIVIGPGIPHSFDMPDNTATALKIHEGTNNYLVFTF